MPFIFFPVAIFAIIDDSDREFMRSLYLSHQESMLRMAMSLTTSRYDAEDVVSDACLSLIKKISFLKTLDCNVLEGYIISTVKNSAYMLHRKRSSRNEVPDDDFLLLKPDEGAAVDSKIMQECTIEELMSAIDKLSESDQAIIRMKYFEHLSDNEIADNFGIKEVSVRSKLTRARQKIYDLLGENCDD